MEDSNSKVSNSGSSAPVSQVSNPESSSPISQETAQTDLPPSGAGAVPKPVNYKSGPDLGVYACLAIGIINAFLRFFVIVILISFIGVRIQVWGLYLF